MEAIARWNLAPPVDPGVKLATKKVLGRVIRRVNRHLTAAGTDTERLHDARKGAKRLRYVAEVVQPLTGSAAKIAKRAKKLQTRLGEHQDATAAATFLHEQGRSAGARPDDNGFSYGLLVAEQRRRAAAALAGVPTSL